jgi:NADH-quinone oxidoreductase subunit L
VFMVFYGKANWRDEHDEQAVTSAAGEQPASVGAAGDSAPAVTAGAGHGGSEGYGEPHESPWLMTVPLVVLGVLSVFGGVLNLPFNSDTMFLEHWLEPVVGENQVHIDVATGTKVALAVVAVAAALVGIAAAYSLYLRRRTRPAEPAVLAHAWYYDETLAAFVGGPGEEGFEGIAAFDRTVIDGGAVGVAEVIRRVGGGLRHIQTGFVRSYALGVAAGVVVVLGYFISRVSF